MNLDRLNARRARDDLVRIAHASTVPVKRLPAGNRNLAKSRQPEYYKVLTVNK